MDDPWGSPWATAAPAQRTPSPTKSDLEPPPRAFLSTTSSPRLPAVSVSVESPWADDNDGFGDWAAADTTTTSVQSASGWGGGWGGADTPGSAHGNRHLTPTPKDEGFGFGQASPIAWPGSIASPSSKNGQPSTFRQPSPDPWASEFDDFKEARDVQSTPRLVLDQPSTPSSPQEMEASSSEEQPRSIWDNEDAGAAVDAASGGAAVAHGVVNGPSSSIMEPDAPKDNISSDHVAQSRPSTSSGPRSSHSRSSSTSRHDSDFDGDRQDSPITSVDEDAKSRIAPPARKVSGKIQVLVEKYDGLAKATVDEPRPVRRESSVTPQTRATPGTETPSEEATDFGDFEQAEEAPSTPPPQDWKPSSPRHSLERSPTPRMRSPETPTRQRPASAVFASPPSAESPVVKMKPPKFDIDLKQVDRLFDDLQLDPPASRHEIESALPDNIITDSFTQISERKAWYRISRQGSSRMHNSGDSENYRRIAWPTTTVHDETLKIVRRWMEQDSITGRTTLGGGANRTNMFNWDSAAEPVALEQIFAKRRRQPRPTSLQQPVKLPPLIPPAPTPPPGSTTNSSVTAPKLRPMSLAGPAAASFGWSSSPVEQGPVEKLQTIQPTKPVQNQDQPLALAPSQITTSPNPPLSQAEDDDDEWGEMVSSPPVDAKPMTLPAFDGTDTKRPNNSAGATTHPPAIPAFPAGRPSADAAHSSIEDLWELPQPDKPSKPPPTETKRVAADPLSYFDQAVMPTVTAAASHGSANFTPTTPLAISSPLPIPVEIPVGKAAPLRSSTDDQTDVDSSVRRIIDNLPDLSYMLRR